MTQIRVGIPILGSKEWYAGVSTVEWLIKAIALLPETERPELYLVVTNKTLKNFEAHKHFATLFKSIIFCGENLAAASLVINTPLIHCPSIDQLFNYIDFVYPANSSLWPGRYTVSWIPDFQHRYLPKFFSKTEYNIREKLFAELAAKSPVIVFTTQTVKNDFLKFYPDSTAITKVLSAPFYPNEDFYLKNPLEVQKKYQLPDNFILCCNQFWIHKNHPILFKALAILRQAGQDVHLVCTGFKSDYRLPDYFDKIQEYIELLGINDHIHILGLIPRNDQIQLIRRSLFVVQPSLFEGLSMIVEECQAFGKNIILSDLDAHLEHGYGIYFERNNAQDLAQKILDLIPTSTPGPNLKTETSAQNNTLNRIKLFAAKFCTFAQEMKTIFHK